jgi:hypothetical protein
VSVTVPVTPPVVSCPADAAEVGVQQRQTTSSVSKPGVQTRVLITISFPEARNEWSDSSKPLADVTTRSGSASAVTTT